MRDGGSETRSKRYEYEPHQYETNRVSHSTRRYLNEQFKSCMKLFREAIEASKYTKILSTYLAKLCLTI